MLFCPLRVYPATAGLEGKQYPYYGDKKKREYLPPSEAEARGLVRADKHPKSNRYGKQNPISERWNGKEQLVAWRAAWADVANRYKELPMEKIISIDELNRAVMGCREDVVIDLCKVLDHAPDKSSGKRRQKVEIFFNFVDEVEIPVLAKPMIAESTLGRRKTA